MVMYSLERQDKILEILKEKKSVSVEKLMKLMYVSPATIRRDLSEMEKRGLVQRTFGGVVLRQGPGEESSYIYRETRNTKEKAHIAKLASELITDNSSLFIDSSTTATFLVPFFRNYRRLTIITNSLNIALMLGNQTSAEVFLTSGYLNARSGSVMGWQTANALTKTHTKYALVSCSALNLQYGAMESTSDQSEVKLQMIRNCDCAILLADAQKIGKNDLFQTVSLSSFKYIVTDKEPNQEFKDYCQENNVKILF